MTAVMCCLSLDMRRPLPCKASATSHLTPCSELGPALPQGHEELPRVFAHVGPLTEPHRALEARWAMQ